MKSQSSGNCSRCQPLGAVLAFAPRSQFELLKGEDNLTEYRFNKEAIAHRRTNSIEVSDVALSCETEPVRQDCGLITMHLCRCVVDLEQFLRVGWIWSMGMVRKTGWMDSPSFNWVATAVSALMLILYVQEMLGPEQRPITGYVLFGWALMFAVWLATAIYKTWFRNGRKE